MAIVRWEPAREVYALEREINRLFSNAFDTQTGVAFKNGRTRWIVAMDLVEEGDHFVLRADLPGLTEDDIKIELQDNVLTVSGERRSEHEDRKGGYYRVERASGAFSRSLTLPERIDPDSIQASFQNGVLEVKVPKPHERQPHRIEINGDKTATIEGSETSAAGSETSAAATA